MTTDESIFLDKLLKSINSSTKFTSIQNQLTKSQKKEYFMIQRLQKSCEKYNLKCLHNKTNSNDIDCYIESTPVQLKYASFNQRNRKTIMITVRKSGGRINSKNFKIPYHLNDNFEYLIVELETFHDQFCIIPKSKLVDMKCISSDTQTGTGLCYVAPPNYEKFHWTLQFWNKWNLLT